MPTVELSRIEAREGDLPLVCLVCGQAGDVRRNQAISYRPWWIYLGIPAGLLPFLVLFCFCNRRGRIVAPFCLTHKFHWTWRTAVVCIWFLFSLVLLVAALLMHIEGKVTDGRSLRVVEAIAQMSLFAAIGSLLAWPVLALGLRYTGVYASQITTHEITLENVPSEFVEALRVHRQDRQPDLDSALGAPRYPQG